MKSLLALLALACAAFGGYCGAAPYLTATSMRSAIAGGDAVAFDKNVDYPALKAQLTAESKQAASSALGSIPGMLDKIAGGSADGKPSKDSGFARSAIDQASSAFASVAKAAIDAALTPRALMSAMGSGAGISAAASSPSAPTADWHPHWRSADRFDIVVNAQGAEPSEALTYEFRREGALDWKLVAIE